MSWPRAGTRSRSKMNAQHSVNMKKKWMEPGYRDQLIPHMRAIQAVSVEARRKFAPGTPQPAQRFGLTIDEYFALTANGCEGCGATHPRAHIDHDHSLGKCREAIRGALCGNCNRALGIVKESVETLTNLIEYLKRARARRAEVKCVETKEN